MGVHVTTAFPGPLRTGHAARHAPPGAREDRRMAPERAARIVLQAALRKRATCHPGMAAKAAAIAGSLFPGLADRLMRRNLFRRMDGGAW
jgi:short-subunit dehydrogenase